MVHSSFEVEDRPLRYIYWEMDLVYSHYSLLCNVNVNKLKAEKYEIQTQYNSMVNSLIQRGTFCLKTALKK